MQDISASTLMEMTIGLASGVNDQDRFNRLIDAIRKTITCDCVALLSLQGDTLVPIAMQGLSRDTFGRRFIISEHPRFDEICASRSPVRFDADSPLPDPFDGLLIDHDGDLPMHACMGLPLLFGDKLLGVLTLDSLKPDFEQEIDNRLASPVSTTSQDDTRFSPQVGAVYLFDDTTSVYATYGEGFRQLTGSDFAGNPFEPNESKSAEIGVKADLTSMFNNIRGDITFAVFNIEQSNILVYDDSPEASDGFFLTPAGEARSRGVELDINAEFENDISLWVSYTFVDAESTNDAADANFVAAIESGDPLINVPENQLSIQLSKGLTFADMPVRIGSGLLYVDERLGQTATDFYLPSYTTVRAFAEIEPVENLSVKVAVDNLFDEEFYTNSFADVWVEPGAPQRFRLSAAYRF